MTPQPGRHERVGGGDRTREAVRPGCECPTCRERDMDVLVWLDDDVVRCATCGTRYNPATGRVVDHGDQAD